jgi:hypothetical protein
MGLLQTLTVKKDGIVFVIVGTDEVNFYSFDGQAPFVDTQFANKF